MRGFCFSFATATAAAAASLEPLKCHNGDAKLLGGWRSGHPINPPFCQPPCHLFISVSTFFFFILLCSPVREVQNIICMSFLVAVVLSWPLFCTCRGTQGRP